MKFGIMVLNKVELLDKLLSELGDAGIGGATILSSTGMARELAHSHEDMSFLGSLRAMLDPDREENKTILMVLRQEQVETVRAVCKSVLGDLSKPDTAIFFTVPVDFVEGVCF